MAGDEDDVTVIQPDKKDNDVDTTPVCMVCYNVFHSKTRVPKILPCGHSFCQECVVGIINSRLNDNPVIGCATCRKSYKIDSKNPYNSVPTNFVLRDLLEKNETSESGPQLCFHLCCDCRKEVHEKDLLFCKTCTPGDVSGNSLDFMGRPKVRLSCTRCIETNHTGHTYDSSSIVAGRWKHRFLYEKFEKVAKEESMRVQKLMITLKNAVNGMTKYNNDLQETIRQLKNNCSTDGISIVLRNFVKAAQDSSHYLDMSTECISRLNNTNSPHYNLVGRKLFLFAKIQRNSEHLSNYSLEFPKLFATVRPASSFSNSPFIDLTDGESRSTNSKKAAVSSQAHAVSQAPDDQPGPAPPAHDVQNPQPVRGAFLRTLQAVADPPVQPMNNEQLNVMMNYYFNIAAPQRANYAGMMLFDAGPVRYDMIRQARDHAFNVANQYAQAQHHQAQPLHQNAPITLRTFYQLPFHLFNAYLPQLYNHTVEEVIALFVNLIVVQAGGDEAHEFFFIPPYENRQFSEIGKFQINRILNNMMGFLIRGEILYTYLESLKLAINQREVGNNAPFVDPENQGQLVLDVQNDAPQHQQIHQQNVNVNVINAEENVIVQQQDQLQQQLDDRGLFFVPFPDGVEQIPNNLDDLLNQQHDDDVEVVAEQNVALVNVVANQEVEIMNVQPGEGIVFQNNQVQVQPQRDPQPDDSDDEGIEMLRRAPRGNYTFQLEDLVPGPPARATRGAKRRAEEINHPGNHTISNVPKNRTRSASNARQAHRATSTRGKKRYQRV